MNALPGAGSLDALLAAHLDDAAPRASAAGAPLAARSWFARARAMDAPVVLPALAGAEERRLEVGPGLALEALMHGARGRVLAARAALAERMEEARAGLRRELGVARARAEVDAADPAAGALGGPFAARLLDVGRMREVIASRRPSDTVSVALEAGMARALATLESAELAGAEPVVHVHRSSAPREAAASFDAAAARALAELRALWLAELACAGEYDPQRHDPWLARIDWRGCSDTDIAAIDPVLLVLDEADLDGRAAAALDALFASGRPIRILVEARPLAALLDPPPPIAALALRHRGVFVEQASIARAGALLAGIESGLAARGPTLHRVDEGRSLDAAPDAAAARHVALAALEGRLHPLFRRAPVSGLEPDAPLPLDENPAAGEDWPRLELEDAELRPGAGPGPPAAVAVTSADAALLAPSLAGAFHPVPAGERHAELTPVELWMELSEERAYERIPFLWARAEDGTAVRLVPARALALACREAMAGWRALRASSSARERAAQGSSATSPPAAAPVAPVATALDAAMLDAVRAEATRSAVAGILAGLLGPDGPEAALERILDAPIAAPAPASAPAAEQTAAPAPAGGGPWIESELCTSCNECIQINSRMFAYDADRHAVIADARAGTYRQLVTAAERCPARIIHPGDPLDPGEADLDRWRERARRLDGSLS